jgi:hypothetical protein
MQICTRCCRLFRATNILFLIFKFFSILAKKSNPSVKRSLAKRQRGDTMVRTCTNIFTTVNENAVYKPIQPLMPMLQDKTNTYQTCLATKQMTGELGTENRDACLADLVECLDLVFDALDTNNEGDPTYITRLGLTCQKTTRSNVEMKGEPVILSAQNTKKFGQIAIKMEKMEGARCFGFEWSDDGGKTRHNGQYSFTLTPTLKVTPHSEIMVWAFGLGNGDEKSELSNPIICRSL